MKTGPNLPMFSHSKIVHCFGLKSVKNRILYEKKNEKEKKNSM